MKLKEELDSNNTFFTSDTHFFHENIIKYCDRPFKNAYEMNETILYNWNKVINKDSTVFLLGDVALTAPKKALHELLFNLNGKIHLIVGNHERDALRASHIRERWATISDICEISIKHTKKPNSLQQIILCHFPMLRWNGSHRGTWQLFGHVHGNLNRLDATSILSPNQMNIGVDTNNFTPYTFKEVEDKITKNILK